MPNSDRTASRNPRRAAKPARPAPASVAGRPVQLELFGGRTALPASPSAPKAPPRPVVPPLSRAEVEARRYELLRRLNRYIGGKVSEVSLHDNRRVILSVRAGRTSAVAPLRLRIHRSFIEAPEEVLRAVADFVQSRNGSPDAREALGVIREHFHRHRVPRRSVQRLDPVGSCFDLREIRDDLNQRFFAGRLKVDVTWGRSAQTGGRSCRGRRGTATIQLGSYSYEERLVRLHRLLDDPCVPRYVIEAVVYHELLHADLPPVMVNGRHHFHTPEFRRRERLYRHLAKTEAWVEENLPRLLRRRSPAQREKPRRRS